MRTWAALPLTLIRSVRVGEDSLAPLAAIANIALSYQLLSIRALMQTLLTSSIAFFAILPSAVSIRVQ
jgi:hypothetical protein